jgi:hypothetical protein
VIIGDDSAEPPVRRAFDEFFAGRSDVVVALPWSHGQAIVVKT